MERPWDILREQKKPPMKSGRFKTFNYGVNVHVHINGRLVSIGFGAPSETISNQSMDGAGCRELAEFFNELADQLEGK